MFRAATIKDIARALSMSPSTVSRALRDSHEVSAETRQRVLDYAKQVNYQYNPAALSLRTRRSNAIGVMVSDVSNPFFAQTIKGIESIAYEKGYQVIISQSHELYEREVANMEHMANRSVDGLLISVAAQTNDHQHIRKLHDNGLPIVFFDRVINDIDTFRVTTDNFASVYKVTQLLLDKGYKRIAVLANAPHLSITIDRVNGYIEALQAAGMPVEHDLIKYCHHGGRDTREVADAVQAILNDKQTPDALFIASDLISTASIRTLKQMGRPVDIPIIGFSNSEVVDLLSPRMAYIRQPAFEMGQIAAQMLIKLIESKYPIYEFETRLLQAEIYWNE